MTVESDLGLVIDVACLIEDRAPDEQRAMLATALRLDCELGAFTVGNRWLQRPRYVRRVIATYNPAEGKPAGLSKQQLVRYRTLAGRWALCDECGYPMGGHYEGDKCPTLASDVDTLNAALER